MLVAGQHLAKLLGGWRNDGDEIGFAEPALGAMALEVTARAQRRLREAYFVAIVTPATKQLRKMLAGDER